MATARKTSKKTTTRGRKVASAPTARKKAAAPASRKVPTNRSKAKPRSQVKNPFDAGTPRHAAAALLLKGKQVSFDELREATENGSLSPRSLGAVIVELEALGARFSKVKDPEWGVCYEYDTSAPLIGKHDGPEATGEGNLHRAEGVRKSWIARKAAAKKKTGKKAPKAAAKRASAKKPSAVAKKASKTKTPARRRRRA